MTDQDNAGATPDLKPLNGQIPFGTDDFAMNPEPRCPCLLLLDVSGSMQGNPIQQLNAGLVQFKDELFADSLASKRVEVALVTFGGEVTVVNDFQNPSNFQTPTLEPKGNTPMGEAIVKGLTLLKQRKETYKSNGVGYYRPWVFLLTDGGPTDSWTDARTQIHEGEKAKAFAFFAVGVEEANMTVLKEMAVREPLKLQGLAFRKLFVWLSSSMKAVSASVPGEDVKLENPTGPSGWAAV